MNLKTKDKGFLPGLHPSYLFWSAIFLSLPMLLPAAQDIQSKKSSLSHTARISPQPFLEIVEGFLKALRAKDLEKAYQDYTTTEFQKKTPFSDFQTMIANYKPLNNNKLFQFQSFFVENDVASFDGELNSEEGESIPVEFDFALEDGKWKILGMQIYKNEVTLPFHEE